MQETIPTRSIPFPRTTPSLVLCLSALLFPGPASEAAPAPRSEAAPQATCLEDSVLTSVQFEGIHSLDRETLLHYLGLAEGARLSSKALNAGIQRLWASGLVDDVEIETLPDSKGMGLVVRIVERPVLVSVDYDGPARVSREDILDLIHRERIRLDEGAPLELGEVSRLRAALEKLYRDKGFRLAEVTYDFEDVSPREKRLTYRIDEGGRVKIGQIEFEGNTAFSDSRLRRAMKKSKETGIVARLRKRDIFKTRELHQDLEAVKDLYRQAGYKNVRLGEPRLDTPRSGPTLSKRHLAITIPVEEGRRFKLGEITIDGNEVLSDQHLLKSFVTSQEWLSSELIDRAVGGMKQFYRNRGYLAAEVSVTTRERRGDVADLVVQVKEGEVYTVGRLHVLGNAKTRDKVLRREIRVQEGAILNMDALDRSLVKIQQLGFFELDDEEPVTFRFDDEARTVDVLIHGKEANQTEVQFGASWDPEESLSGLVSLNTRNLLGRGESLGFSLLQGGGPRDSYQLFYSIPWLFDRPQQFGTNLFQNRQFYGTLAGTTSFLEEVGASVSYGRALGLFDSVAVTLEQKDSRQRLLASDPADPLGLSFASTSFQGRYVYDSRNSRVAPTTGTRFSGGMTYAGGFLGGDRSFLRPELGLRLFRPVSRSRLSTVFAFNTEAGWILPFEGQTLFPLEGYFLGGPDSVRGFRPASLWSRDDNGAPLFQNGFSVGGSKFFQLNLEYHLLVGGPLRLVLYADAGNVFGADRPFDLRALRYTAGSELRVNVPFLGAPLRFIYAVNLDPLPGDEFESLRFSFGTGF